MTTDTRNNLAKPGWLPGVTAILAFVACNGVFVLVALLSSFGIAIAVNPHIQAGVISLFALLTFGFVVMAYRQHHVRGPLVLSVIGAIVLIGSMYIYFNKIVESLGLLALIVSAVWSWRAGKVRTHSTGTL
ncbi:MAG: MerC domain-containing protein [Burkholderiales bacterium]